MQKHKTLEQQLANYKSKKAAEAAAAKAEQQSKKKALQPNCTTVAIKPELKSTKSYLLKKMFAGESEISEKSLRSKSPLSNEKVELKKEKQPVKPSQTHLHASPETYEDVRSEAGTYVIERSAEEESARKSIETVFGLKTSPPGASQPSPESLLKTPTSPQKDNDTDSIHTYVIEPSDPQNVLEEARKNIDDVFGVMAPSDGLERPLISSDEADSLDGICGESGVEKAENESREKSVLKDKEKEDACSDSHKEKVCY